MPRAALAPLPALPENVFTERAAQYVTLAHQSAGRALNAMHELRAARRRASGRAQTGQTSDQDQDLLRAMLVFACAGIDAAMKALIEDSLPTLADRAPEVQRQLETFAAKRLAVANVVDPTVLGRVMSNPTSPRQGLVDEFVQALTGGSLQSTEELQRVRAAFGIEGDRALTEAITALRPAFQARNEISHEMDLNPAIERRVRRHRRIGEMVEMADAVLAVGCRMIAAVTAATGGAAGGQPA